MATLGAVLLLSAFVISAYAAAASVVGARRHNNRLTESGVGALYLVAAVMTVATGVIVHAFVVGNYTIKYVQRYSESAQPLGYKLASYWGGLDGSVMFWVFLLSLFGAAAVRINKERHRELIPYVVATLSVVQMFFLFLMIAHNNPFATYLTDVPREGAGLNPLLQNFYMAIHPPTMYLGFVGMTIPFAFCIAALITGHLDDSWLRAVRRWTMISWFCLSLGLTLGMIWAYEELGWGGFWGWDPVENAGLLPWFTATAFLHSVMVQERRGMLRVWNVTLVIVTFFLTLFGTFMTRSGVVQSVHAFGEDKQLAMMFMVFMSALLIFSFGWVIYRLPLLKARNELDSWASKEAAFLANNWVLLFSALFVLFATMFPTLTEAITGERLTVGPPFFNTWMTPVGLILLLLTGIGPLLAWRSSSVSVMWHQFKWPIASGVAAGVLTLSLGIRVWSSGLCFALSGFVVGTMVQEFVRGAGVRRQTTGTDLFTAMVGLVSRNKRRYGGYIVHVGIVLMFMGFAGEGFGRDEQALLKPGQQVTIDRYVLRLDSIRATDDGQKQMVTAQITVQDTSGATLGTMYPAKWFYRSRPQEPTTEVAIRRSLAEDLYIVMAAFELGDQSASVEVHVNELVNWIWIGFGLMAIGTGIALLPETVLAMAGARAGAEVAATLLLAGVLLTPVGARAQTASDGAASTGAPATGTLVFRSALERDLANEIMCTCGCRLPAGTCGMTNCEGKAAQLAKIKSLVAEGKDRDAVLASFVEEFGGQHILARPLDEGYHKLLWLLPYTLALLSAVGLAFIARRWASGRREAAAAAGAAAVAGIDPGLQQQLDDELRDLD
ncbi:MAG: cytochrome c biogenesis protein CcsA [Acidobacteria bacterium]|nr:cytochrome c biogenesis protein CcsA [Acidobacteriota bacterium]